jgi:ribosome modulation factor
MRTHLRQLAVAAALTIGASVVAAIPAMAQQDGNRSQRDGSSQAQRTDSGTYAARPDYSNNGYYRTGNEEGYQDYQAKKQREKHEHQYKTDDDRKAHDNGYQEGWSGRSYRDNQNYRDNQKHDKDDDHDSH